MKREDDAELMAFLRARYRYDPDTGIVWSVLQGRPVGAVDPTRPLGGLKLTVTGSGQTVIVKVHRLCWYLHTGAWPKQYVDHANRDPHDNRWANLRLATHAENARNAVKRQSAASRFKGVSLDRSTGRWRARIHCGRPLTIGSFATEIEAAQAYDVKARELFGAFAAPNF